MDVQPRKLNEFKSHPGYRVGNKIGGGSYGEILEATCLATGKKVAVKIEPANVAVPRLPHECHVYKALKGNPFIPHLYWYGYEGKYFVMVMELCGPNLDEVLQEHKFSIPTNKLVTYICGMLDCVRSMHMSGFIHRDLKPANFTLSLKYSDRVNILDFGLSKRYMEVASPIRTPSRMDRGMVGTARYTSINSHLSLEQHMRDDVESLAYVFIYLYKGTLPWMGIDVRDRNLKYDIIKSRKMDLGPSVIAGGCPSVFRKFLIAARSLQFGEEAHFTKWKVRFRELLKEQSTTDSLTRATSKINLCE